jgi:TRAP transporter TAXI family solute receptor
MTAIGYNVALVGCKNQIQTSYQTRLAIGLYLISTMKLASPITVSGFSLVFLLGVLLHSGEQKITRYTIGTGSYGATFYPLALALCTVLNQKGLEFTCEAVSTAGSVYNLMALDHGEHDLALSQFNLQFQAYRGLAPFQNAHEQLTTVAALHQEIFILAVNPASGITRLADLPGKRVNIGNVGSGSRVIIEELFRLKGWTLAEFEVFEKKSSELPRLLCNEDIDAAIYSTGHPNAIYQDMIGRCGIELINLWDQQIETFVAENWQFSEASIPANTYHGMNADKLGFGVRVVLSASNEIPPKHIYQIIQTIVEEQNKLQNLAPIYQSISGHDQSLRNVAPWHKGARQYFADHAIPYQ